MRKVIYISGTRADYALMRRVLVGLRSKVEVMVIATCMHLSPHFGYTVREIEADGFLPRRVEMLIDGDTPAAMAKSVGVGLYGITQVLEEEKPDLVLVEGDRGESLAGAVASAFLNIPVVHHGGGDLSGSVDNRIRYALTAIASYHLVGNEGSYHRLRKMGIPADRLFLVGEPGIDDIILKDYTGREELTGRFGIDPSHPLLVVLFHPNTEEFEDTGSQVNALLAALKYLRLPTIAIFSNADAGGGIINDRLSRFAQKNKFLQVYPHINRKDFLGLLSICSALVGNSSAGITELPSFKKPFIYIGTRQRNRMMPGNTVPVGYGKDEIVAGITRALHDEEFLERLHRMKNPYEIGLASEAIITRIAEILSGLPPC